MHLSQGMGQGWLPIRAQTSSLIFLESGHFSVLCAEKHQEKALSYEMEERPTEAALLHRPCVSVS